MAQADVRELPLDVGVRAKVDRPFRGFGKEPLRDFGRSYYVLNIQYAKSELDLVAPVNEKEVLVELHAMLQKNGYRQISDSEEPQILLTVAYGRGYLPNPYLANATPTAEGLLSSEAGIGTPAVSVTNPIQVFKQKQAGFEAKLQNANLEKLYLRVSAYEYPKENQKQPRQVWQVTMLVDAPHRMDLNVVYKAMLAAGVPYFNKEVEDQVDIRNPLHRGNVEVGIPIGRAK
ncbi:MAG TPA: hypothetical protein PLN52_08040 [Opitutaceae bacterium]|nr:hypothetical protein [Opitutaceae bacterium]